MRTIAIWLLLTTAAIATDYTVTLDPALAPVVSRARTDDNAAPTRDPKSPIVTDTDWLNTEIGALLRARQQQQQQVDIQAAVDAMKTGDASKANALATTFAKTPAVIAPQ